MPSATSKRLYLKGLRKDITQEDLSKYLSCYGPICEVKILANYAFVQFETAEDALAVLETYRNQPLLGKRTLVEFAHPMRKNMPSISSSSSSPKPYSRQYSGPRPSPNRHPVVVLDLPRDIGWQELKDFGRLSGMLVAYCDLDKTQTGRGFIEFFSREDAKRAIDILDGQRLSGKRVRVVDHEDMRESRSRMRRSDRTRSRSPRRRYTSSRSGNNEYSMRPEFHSSAHKPYSVRPHRSEVDYDYDYHDPPMPSSTFPSQVPDVRIEQDESYSYRTFIGANVDYPTTQRVSAWQTEHHHLDYYHQAQDYGERQYPDAEHGGPYDSLDPGYEPHFYEAHHFQRLMDPYQ